jgi:hypothetical protein
VQSRKTLKNLAEVEPSEPNNDDALASETTQCCNSKFRTLWSTATTQHSPVMISSRTLLLLATVFTSSVLTGAFQLVSPPMRTLLGKPAVSPETFSASRRLRPQVVYASYSADPPEENETETPEPDEEDALTIASKLTLVERIKKGFAPQNDGLTFKQRLGKMGLSMFLSYGWVSNMSYSVTVSLAWYIFSKRVRNECSLWSIYTLFASYDTLF